MRIIWKIYSKIFLFITIIVVFMLCDCRIVNAESVDKCAENVVFNKYKPMVNSTVSDVTIKITYDDSVDKTEYKDVVFTLQSAKYGDKFLSEKKITETYQLSADIDKSLVLSVDTIKNWIENKDTVMLVFKKTAGTDPDCNKDISFTIKIVGLGRSSVSSGYSGKLDADYDYGYSKIDCNNKSSWGSGDVEFNTHFCTGKSKAESLGHIYDFATADSTISEPLKCKKNHIYQEGELKDEYYYTNVDYYFGTNTVKSKEPVKSYTYHFSPGVESKKVNIYCEKTCDEEVEVYYGPPIASRAGLCFEYNVKLISRTNCYPSGKLPAPETYSVCTPYPYCTEPGWEGNAGGPNEDFDRCVKSCDGGKYTKKCSSKCYNSVYKKSNKMNSINTNYFANKLGNHGLHMGNNINKAIKDCANNDSSAGYYRNGEKNYGCYYYDGSTIRWYGLEANIKYYNYSSVYHAPGRWYKTVSSWGIGTAYEVPYDEGFYRQPYGGNSWCTDTCSWNGCPSTGNSYLNDYNKLVDEKNNKKAFEDAKGLCGMITSCTKTETTTTTFTMKAKIYSDDAKNPYKGTDSITIKKDGVESSTKEYGSIIKENDNYKTEDGKDYDVLSARNGCYDSGASLFKNRYRVKLGFPGTWFSIKTGAMSYEKKSVGRTSEWYGEDDKFCLPTNLSKTNEAWLNFYLNNYKKTIPERKKITESSVPDAIYNIEATIKDFGYYKWGFVVKCFFASDCPGDSCSYDSNIKVRPVDLNNMFPKVNDPELLIEDKSKVETEYPFNWSSNATTEKNEGYVIKPEELRNKIKSSSGSIYDENNLEYSFNLTPSKINSLKSKNKNYTLFSEGTYYKVCNPGDTSCAPASPNGVARYVSGVISTYADKRPIEDAVGGKGVFCNNIKSTTTWECEDFG